MPRKCTTRNETITLTSSPYIQMVVNKIADKEYRQSAQKQTKLIRKHVLWLTPLVVPKGEKAGGRRPAKKSKLGDDEYDDNDDDD